MLFGRRRHGPHYGRRLRFGSLAIRSSGDRGGSAPEEIRANEPNPAGRAAGAAAAPASHSARTNPIPGPISSSCDFEVYDSPPPRTAARTNPIPGPAGRRSVGDGGANEPNPRAGSGVPRDAPKRGRDRAFSARTNPIRPGFAIAAGPARPDRPRRGRLQERVNFVAGVCDPGRAGRRGGSDRTGLAEAGYKEDVFCSRGLRPRAGRPSGWIGPDRPRRGRLQERELRSNLGDRFRVWAFPSGRGRR
jgi:hypothetical protein